MDNLYTLTSENPSPLNQIEPIWIRFLDDLIFLLTLFSRILISQQLSSDRDNVSTSNKLVSIVHLNQLFPKTSLFRDPDSVR